MKYLVAAARQSTVIILASIMMPLAILIIVIRPIKHIRVGRFSADRLGHLALDAELYLSNRNLENKSKGLLDIFFFEGRLCNQQLGRMIKRTTFVLSWVRYLYIAISVLPFSSPHVILTGRESTGSRDITGCFSKVGAQLFFTPRENRLGFSWLQSHNLGETTKNLVCLNVRDAAYLNKFFPRKGGRQYHSYRDSEISDYRESALYLAEAGYIVVRMGQLVKDPLGLSHNNIIDYAISPERSDFLDIWLIANCAFCISTASGLDSVAVSFRRPLVLVNMLPLADIGFYSSYKGPQLFFPKTLTWKSSGKTLSLHEYFECSFRKSNDYERHGITVTDLSPFDILDAVKELIAIIDGSANHSTGSNKLQQHFWEIFQSSTVYLRSKYWVYPKARIATTFLVRQQN